MFAYITGTITGLALTYAFSMMVIKGLVMFIDRVKTKDHRKQQREKWQSMARG